MHELRAGYGIVKDYITRIFSVKQKKVVKHEMF